MEACVAQLELVKDSKTRRTFQTIFRIYGLDILKRDQGYYMGQGVMSVKQGKALPNVLNYWIKQLAPSTTDVIESLNVPTHALHTPIAADYIKYNATPNYGEVVNAKL